MDEQRVKKHFEEVAEDFDGIYENRGNVLDRFVNRVFRRSMYERVGLTLQECGDVQNKRVLDIGCGSGRISLALAEKGAEVVGIDFSSRMIDLANDHIARSQTKVNIKFLCCDFLQDFHTDRPFNITLALGLFDYIRDPLPLLKKMRDLTGEQMIASYPAKFAFHTPLRKVWLYAKKCPVYFYTERDLRRIYELVGVTSYKVVRTPVGSKFSTAFLVKATI